MAPSLIWPNLSATAPGQVALDRTQRRREAPNAAYRIHWRWAAWKGLGLKPGWRRPASEQGRQQQVTGRSGLGGVRAIIARINERPRQAISAWLVQDEKGQPLSSFALRSRFDKARTLAPVDFQFRDIRAKAATDAGDLAHSHTLLGHENREMTEHYAKARTGARVKPLR